MKDPGPPPTCPYRRLAPVSFNLPSIMSLPPFQKSRYALVLVFHRSVQLTIFLIPLCILLASPRIWPVALGQFDPGACPSRPLSLPVVRSHRLLLRPREDSRCRRQGCPPASGTTCVNAILRLRCAHWSSACLGPECIRHLPADQIPHPHGLHGRRRPAPEASCLQRGP